MSKNKGNVSRQILRRKHRHLDYIRTLRSTPCQFCNEQFHFSAMKFIFKEGMKEGYSLSKMALWSKDRIDQEVSKCNLLCANCVNYQSWTKAVHSSSDPLALRGGEFIRSLKENKPCIDCNRIFHFSSMEFDHRTGEIKRRNISKMERYSLQNIQMEVDKCDLVCSCCHHIRTWTRLNT